MTTTLLHVQLEASTPSSFDFYRRLFARLGLRTVDEGADYLGVTDERVMLVLRCRAVPAPKEGRLGFRVDSRAAVDQLVTDFLSAEGITPVAPAGESSEYAEGYYAVRFDAPDTTLVEVAWFRL